MPINLASFERQLTLAEMEAPKLLTRAVKKLALEVLRGVVLRTPVLTGRARGNWQVSINVPVEGEVSTTDQNGTETIMDGMSALASLGPFMAVWVVNNLPYIEALEDGHSKQAPDGMVALTLADIETRFGTVEG